MHNDQCEFEFNNFNHEFSGTVFEEIFDYCKNHWLVGRMRLMNCAPRHCYSMHEDDSQNRYHIAIQTNVNAYLLYDTNQVFHIPADGHVYEVRTDVNHTALNAGNEDRIHLVYELANHLN